MDAGTSCSLSSHQSYADADDHDQTAEVKVTIGHAISKTSASRKRRVSSETTLVGSSITTSRSYEENWVCGSIYWFRRIDFSQKNPRTNPPKHSNWVMKIRVPKIIGSKTPTRPKKSVWRKKYGGFGRFFLNKRCIACLGAIPDGLEPTQSKFRQAQGKFRLP